MEISEIPYSGKIKIGDTTSFKVGNDMVAVQVYAVGWDTVDIRTMDLKNTWTISKTKWLQQVGLIKENTVNA